MKPQLHTPSFKITILVLSFFGLLTFCLYLPKSKRKLPTPQPDAIQASKPSAPSTKLQVKSTRNKTAIKDTLALSIPLVTKTKNDIAIFKNGSCVINQTAEAGSIVHSTVLLQRLENKDIRFSVHKAENKNYIVFFEGSAIYQWVTNQQVIAIKNLTADELRLYLSPTEQQQLPHDWFPTLEGKIGIVARSWLHQDIEQLKLHRLLQAYMPAAKN